MHAVVEAQSILKAIPRHPDEPKLDWVGRAGAAFGLTFSQAKKIIYGEVKDLRASRLDAMREKLNQRKEGAQKRREKADGIKERLAYLRSARGSGDPGRGGRASGGPDGGSLGAGEGGSRAGGRPAAAAGPDAPQVGAPPDLLKRGTAA